MVYDSLEYYKILGADCYTAQENLKLKYRDQAKFWHPDHNKEKNALENFQKISKAYEVLKDEKSRMIYNLLSMIYSKQEFPDQERLKPYFDASNKQTPYLRVFSLQKIVKGSVITEKVIGTFDDILKFLRQITWQNFKTRFWSAAFYKVLKHNLKETKKFSKDNFKLLVHNAACYYKENKFDLAYLSAKQALDFSNEAEAEILNMFLKTLKPVQMGVNPWNLKKLNTVQTEIFKYLMSIPLGIFLLFVFLFGLKLLLSNKTEKIEYYQSVKFSSGEEFFDDLVTSKIFNIPIDKTDESMLYYITDEVNIMYGPSEKFDVLKRAVKKQTVRVTGYTPDQSWYRIELDNGEMGFIKKKYLKQGIGLDIPKGSQIIPDQNNL